MLIALGFGVGSCDPGPMTSLSGSVDGGPSPPPEVTGPIPLDCGTGPGVLPPLNPGEPAGVGDVLKPLGADGGVSEVSEKMPLGGVIELVEVFIEDIGPRLDSAGVLGCEVGEGLPPTDGKGLVAEGDPPEGPVGDPELGWPENGEPGLGGMDVGDALVSDGPALLGG